MPKCSVKSCKNNTLTKRKKHGISYFRFPQNKIQREKWWLAIKEERGEEYFKPNDSSVVCSDHFAESDMYNTPKGFRRINKNAVPKLEILCQKKGIPEQSYEEYILDENTLSEVGSLQDSKGNTNIICIKKENPEQSYEEYIFDENSLSEVGSLLDSKGSTNIICVKQESPEQSYEEYIFDENSLSEVGSLLNSKGSTKIICVKQESPKQSYEEYIFDENSLSEVESLLDSDGSTSITKSETFTSCTATLPSPLLSPIPSALSSVVNTPKTTFFKRIVRNCNQKLQLKSNLAIENTNLKQILKKIKSKGLVDEPLYNDLNNKANKVDSKMMSILTDKKINTFSKYPTSLRKFALTLQFHSPAAYKYVRNVLNNRLPHPHTLYKWYQSVNAQPGFTEEAFSRLADQAKASSGPLLCSLVADEMSIHQQKIWTGNKYEGLVDMGVGSSSSDILANQAFVFVLVSLHQSWTLPIAYFFIQNLNGEMKANLIRLALQKCHFVGVTVVSITFDGCESNISCMKSLGCNIENHDNMQTTFLHPCGSQKVAVFLDVCHLLKLMRNVLESKKVIYDENNDLVKWQHVVALYTLQEENALHLANKLTLRHLQFHNQVMKVKLASHLLSNDLAQAIQFCDKELNIDQFSHSEATVKFIKLMNDLFDILNSRNLIDFGYKKPLSKDNSVEVLSFCAEAKDYLLSLSTKVMYKKTIKVKTETRVIHMSKTVPLHKHMSNTGVIGLLTCINSLESLYSTLIESSTLSYLPMYTFSQDHIELFFGKVRSQGACNNNPNVRQFKAAYKKLLAHTELSSKFSGNYLLLENVPILQTISTAQNINNTSRSYRHEDEYEDNISRVFLQNRNNQERTEQKYSNNCDQLAVKLLDENFNEVTIPIIGYLCGFVVYHLVKKIRCEDCKNHLLATRKEHFHKLIDLKDVGGLCFASDSVFIICKYSEKILKDYIRIRGCNTILKKYDKAFLSMKIIRLLVNSNIFIETEVHAKDQFNHAYNLTKAIIEKYIDVRLHYICKKENIRKINTTKVVHKLNLFQGNKL